MTEEKVIKDAQYRKGLSIAFFNATNSAIALCQGMNVHETETLKKVFEIRDLMLYEHKKYYATVIASIGAPYKAEDTIKKLKKATNKDELKLMWISISEDERRDGEIIKVVKEIKASFK